ncbi:YceI family protein [Marivibrio halodurans]|uniref:YceI family protein n=1 Tax=Marivibrio halodurans TaxID=2039722 RepID=A0A8J7S8U0_9PROT|nr:YceI family protein [Marivibrio halodurans]MBP5858984.1 YceI family protein [Marivibrio halodurans]
MPHMTKTLSGLAFAAGAFAAITLAPAPAAAEAEEYELDKTHADVVFWVSHLGYSNTWGRFNSMDGTLVLDQEAPENSSIAMVIDAASIDTNLGKRDEHLRSPDFLNAGEFPEITFSSTAIEKTGDKTATVTGDFTLAGVTKTISFDATVNKVAPSPMDKSKEIVGLSAETTIDRTEYGVDYGAGAIGNEVRIFMELEFIRAVGG